MKKFLIAGNWKMNKTIAEAKEFADALLLAGYIESGFKHTASIFSKDIGKFSTLCDRNNPPFLCAYW